MEPGKAEKFMGYEIIARGRVQGVGYRYFALRHAELMGICGWVKNQSDGSVRVFIQGKNANKFIQLLHEGPSFSRVEILEVYERESETRYESFQIR